MKTLSTTTTMLLLTAGTTCAAAQIQQMDPTTGQILAQQAQSTTPEAVANRGVAVWHAGDDAEQLRPAHPPLHLIPAMPKPDVPFNGDINNAGDPGVSVSRDENGQLRFGQHQFGRGFLSGTGAGFNSGEGEQVSEDFVIPGYGRFNAMSQIFGVGSDPWRRTVKIVMRFVDQGGTDRFFVATGTMADAETVLTSGHVVYARTPNGLVINDWAQEYWVYPGWDGDGITADQARIIETHGIGYGSGAALSWTGWTQNGDFDRDLGLIRINRAVGMLTGWFGWHWGGDCNSIQARTYHAAGYPAAGCHNGRDMYYWFGTIDSCPGNQMRVDTDPGCLTNSEGGQSGSGLYYIENSERFVHGVHSNGAVNGTFHRYTKLWESWVTEMQNFENDSRGASFDAQVLRSRYVQSTVTAGQAITGDQYFFTNPTNANPASATYSFTHRLSTNALISAGDVNIGSENVTWDFGAMSSVNVNNTGSSYTIPYNTPSGTYYVGALLASGANGDAVSSNNDASYWDAHELTVNGVADISADSIVPNRTTVVRGNSVTLDLDFSNLGGDPSNSIAADFRLSTNSIISTLDTNVANSNYSGLGGNASSSRSRTVTIPANTAPGTYYLGVILTASDDVQSNNDSVATIAINVTARRCADQNSDGVVSPADFNAWILNFNRRSPMADTNGDGSVTPADFNAWILAYNQGVNGPFCTP